MEVFNVLIETVSKISDWESSSMWKTRSIRSMCMGRGNLTVYPLVRILLFRTLTMRYLLKKMKQTKKERSTVED